MLESVFFGGEDTEKNEITSITCNDYILISIKFQGTLQGIAQNKKTTAFFDGVQY